VTECRVEESWAGAILLTILVDLRKKCPLEDSFSSAECSERLKAVADPDRLMIIQVLRERSQCVSDLATVLEKEVTNISHHLQILKNRGIVTSQKSGKHVIYSLADGVFMRGKKQVDKLDFGCCKIELPQKPT